MPTPSDDHILPPVEVIHVAADAENARYGCPPEDRREQHTPSEEQVETSDSPAGADRTSEVAHEITEPLQAPTPESEGNDGTETTIEALRRQSAKVEQAEDTTQPSSPFAIGLLSPPPDNSEQLAQSMSATAISPEEEEDAPLYLHYPELERNRYTTPNSTTSFLRPGSKFRGTQQSDRQVYDVQVELKDVDLAESTLCGYLRIQGTLHIAPFS